MHFYMNIQIYKHIHKHSLYTYLLQNAASQLEYPSTPPFSEPLMTAKNILMRSWMVQHPPPPHQNT